MTESAISIEVVSDVVCPWCYLGKRRLEGALALLPDVETTVRWRPFRLDPTIPPEGIDRSEYIRQKFGHTDAVSATHDQLVAAGKEVGIDFRFDLIKRSPNSVDAHRLIGWAEADGREDEVVESFFRAYFSEGRDVGDAAVLIALAAEAGMDPAIVERLLRSDQDRTEVEAEIDHAYRIGINGVPCFIIGKRYAVMGAQPSMTIAEAIGTVADERAAAAGA